MCIFARLALDLLLAACLLLSLANVCDFLHQPCESGYHQITDYTLYFLEYFCIRLWKILGPDEMPKGNLLK